MRIWVLVFCVGLLVGCSGTKEPVALAPAVGAKVQAGPEAVYEKLRSSAFQLDAAGENIASALSACQAAVQSEASATEVRSALQEAADFINEAGEWVAELAVEPDRQRVLADPDSYSETLKVSVSTANDALRSLAEAQGIVGSLMDPNANAGTLKDLFDLLELAMADVEGGIEALGGTPSRVAEDAGSPVNVTP